MLKEAGIPKYLLTGSSLPVCGVILFKPGERAKPNRKVAKFDWNVNLSSLNFNFKAKGDGLMQKISPRAHFKKEVDKRGALYISRMPFDSLRAHMTHIHPIPNVSYGIFC